MNSFHTKSYTFSSFSSFFLIEFAKNYFHLCSLVRMMDKENDEKNPKLSLFLLISWVRRMKLEKRTKLSVSTHLHFYHFFSFWQNDSRYFRFSIFSPFLWPPTGFTWHFSFLESFILYKNQYNIVAKTSYENCSSIGSLSSWHCIKARTSTHFLFLFSYHWSLTLLFSWHRKHETIVFLSSFCLFFMNYNLLSTSSPFTHCPSESLRGGKAERLMNGKMRGKGQ